VTPIGVRLNAIGLGRFHQRVEIGTGLVAGNAVAEQPHLSAHAERADGVLDRISIDAVAAIVALANEPVPVVIQVRQRLAQSGAIDDERAGLVELGTQLFEHRECVVLSLTIVLLGWLLLDASLDDVERLDEAEGLERALRLGRSSTGASALAVR
jgi:hypothetical protein